MERNIGHFIKAVLYSRCHSSAFSYQVDSWRIMKYAVVALIKVLTRHLRGERRNLTKSVCYGNMSWDEF